ncbi:hypothetical protein [Streptomyces sp. 6N106]|uniref:hypothetical protein n=1 Tax=Streptomyces sp. 6N106 TaxID=3457418 RepID=UPI003FD3980B
MGEARGEDVQGGRHGALAAAAAIVHEQHRHRAQRGVMGGPGFAPGAGIRRGPRVLLQLPYLGAERGRCLGFGEDRIRTRSWWPMPLRVF